MIMYYYLIASLPSLHFEMAKPPIKRTVFDMRVTASLGEGDKKTYDILQLDIHGRIAGAHKNKFLDAYFSFERNLRNLLTAVNMRVLNYAHKEKITGPDDYISESIRNSNLPDFGIASEMPYVSKVIELINAKKFFEMEKFFDALRFKTIDELNRFNYFTLERVLGYSLQLKILERWYRLTEEEGSKILKKLTKKDIGKEEYYTYIDPRNN